MLHGVYIQKKPPHFIASAHSIINTLDSREESLALPNNATCIMRRGFCTLVLFISEVFSEVENLEYMYIRVVYTWGREKVLSREVT